MLRCDLNLLTLKVCGASNVTWSKSVQNISEIEQSPAELLIILRIFFHAVTLIFDLLTLNFYSTSGVMHLNSVQNLSEFE